MSETTLTSPVEAPVNLELDWILDIGGSITEQEQRGKTLDKWDVLFPVAHPASAMLHLEWVSRGPFELGIWQATILNSYIIEIELSLFQVATAKYRAEQELFKVIRNSLVGLTM